jgi:hypothetical protein
VAGWLLLLIPCAACAKQRTQGPTKLPRCGKTNMFHGCAFKKFLSCFCQTLQVHRVVLSGSMLFPVCRCSVQRAWPCASAFYWLLAQSLHMLSAWKMPCWTS